MIIVFKLFFKRLYPYIYYNIIHRVINKIFLIRHSDHGVYYYDIVMIIRFVYYI